MAVKTEVSPVAPATLGAAEDALRLAQVEPRAAQDLARALLAGAPDDRTGKELSVVAERALGVAARELSDLAGAKAHLERAVAIARSAGLAVREAESRMSLSLTLAYAGQSQQALRQADLAAPALRGVDAAVLHMQRGLILQRLGRLDEALDGYRRALPVMRRAGDLTNQARLLMNRGVLQAYRGQFRTGQADLERAADAFERLDQPLYAAKARHNIGFVVARRGDVAAALRWYDRAEGEYRRLGVSPGVPLLDRSETLLSVRLVPEARDAARRAAAEFEAGGMEADLAQALLLLAQTALLAGDVPESADLASRARLLFLRQHRPGWAALARYGWLRAVWAGGDLCARTLRAARHTVQELLATGWVAPAVDARLIHARIALALGRVDTAEEQLLKVSGARRSGPAELRARAWHAEALLRHARGDRRGTEVALRTGVRILARHQATLGATEIRAHWAARAEELAGLGIQMALESGRADRLLAWAERWRAGALRSRPAMPSANADVARLLVELRDVMHLLEGGGGEDTARLLRRQSAIEAEIRRKTWHAEGDRDPTLETTPSLPVIAEALGDRALVELVESDGWLHAVTVAGRRATLHSLAAEATVETEVDALRFAIARLARDPAPGSLAPQAFDHACDRLEHLLLSPLRASLGDRAVVVVPTGVLHGVPWSTLPSLRGRPVTVAPSAALWLRAGSTPAPAGDRTVLVAGPGLPHARREVAALSRVYPGAQTLVGPAARAATLSGSLNRSDLVHIAAHGTFRADNPLFSSLRLVDGPLTVYDLERLSAAPRRVVLSACDAGQSLVATGDELMGLSAAMLSLGTRTLVASVAAVSDATTSSMMVDFHRALAAGTAPAEALADTQTAFRRDGRESLARTAGFVCFGAG